MSIDGSSQAHVTVPAQTMFVSTLRLATASLAAQCNLTVDDIEDLRLAVDEACALLLPHARTGGAIEAAFTLAPGYLAADVSVDADETEAAREVDRHSYAWTVLNVLAGPVRASTENGRITVGLARRRSANPA